MGKVFLHARSTSKEKADPYATLTVHCPLYSIIRAESVNTTAVFEKESHNGEATFERMTEGEWDITFVGVEHAPTRRVTIGSLDYEMTLGYFEATINVTYPAGATCVATDGKYTLTAPNNSGFWVCTVNNAGTWTITSTYGDNVASTQVVINSDGQTESVELEYFEATVKVTYPVGSTCTASCGNTTLLAPDITGVWTCVIPFAGTWIFKCVDGAKYTMNDITIVNHGDSWSLNMNFPVLAYSTAEDLLSDKPSDSACGIISNAEVSSYIITEEGPQPDVGEDDLVPGLVWILQGDDGGPVSAKHYISGVWIDVPVYLYSDGQWWNYVVQEYLYSMGEEFTDITGGFSSVNILRWNSYSRLTVDTVQKNETHIYLKASSNYQASIASANMIDVTNYSKLTMVINDCSIQSSTTTGGNKLMLTTSRTDASTAVASATIQDGLTEISVDGLSGSYYVVVAVHGVSYDNYAYVAEIYLK